MSIPKCMQGRLSVPVVGAPLFIISNPDLVKRIENNWPLAEADSSTFYTPGPEGYLDYPEFNPSE